MYFYLDIAWCRSAILLELFPNIKIIKGLVVQYPFVKYWEWTISLKRIKYAHEIARKLEVGHSYPVKGQKYKN